MEIQMQQELYYKEALKLGQKEVRAKIAKNEDPYLPICRRWMRSSQPKRR